MTVNQSYYVDEMNEMSFARVGFLGRGKLGKRFDLSVSYTDIRGKRRTIYALDLKELWEKEAKIQSDMYNGID